MAEHLRLRGPDESGFRRVGRAVLGHRRLRIIDLTAGRQPLSNEDRSLWISYNGEVYNFQRLRSQLEGCGHHFQTRTDTEAILHLFEQEGPACFPQLDGMFALALTDGRSLFLARDPLGIKPLYYGRDAEGRFWFASELGALALATPDLQEFPPGC